MFTQILILFFKVLRFLVIFRFIRIYEFIVSILPQLLRCRVYYKVDTVVYHFRCEDKFIELVEPNIFFLCRIHLLYFIFVVCFFFIFTLE